MKLLFYEDGNYFTPEDHFTNKQGLMIAAQIIDLTATGIQVPKEIGNLRIQEWRWGKDANGDYFDYQKNLETHLCSDEELGYTDDPK